MRTETALKVKRVSIPSGSECAHFIHFDRLRDICHRRAKNEINLSKGRGSVDGIESGIAYPDPVHKQTEAHCNNSCGPAQQLDSGAK